MGVKWTCALIFFLGIAHLSVEAKFRDRRAAHKSLMMNRIKRDADANGHRHSHSSSPDGHSFSHSWSSDDGSSGGGGGSGSSWSSSSGGSGGSWGSGRPGHGWSHYGGGGNYMNFGNPGFGWGQHGFRGPNIPDFNNRNSIPNVGSYPYYPNQNSGPFNVPSFNAEDFFQQYLSNLNFQQRLFESRFQNQIPPGKGSWAHAAASMTSPNGGVQPNAKVYTNSWSSSLGTTGQSNFGAGHSLHHENAPADQAVYSQQRFSGQNEVLDYGSPFNNYDQNPYGFNNRGAFGPGFGNFDGFNQGFPNSAGDGSSNFFSKTGGVHSASASVGVGPGGGFREAAVNPSSSGNIQTRFAEQVPPPSGKSYGVFTSTSTHSHTGPDGKTIVEKVATTGINDNGKVSYKTVRDPQT